MQNIPTKKDIMNKDSWIGGPTHHLQRQHIPGYQGHVPQLVSENLFAKPFAKLTADCLEERVLIHQQKNFYQVDKEVIVKNEDRLKTLNEVEFTQPDLRKEYVTQTVPEKIVEQLQQTKQQQKILEESKKPLTINDIPPIDRIPVVGWMGYQPKYRYPIKQISQPPAQDPNKMNAKVEDLSYGFQKTLLEQDDIKKQFVETKVPIVGYTGFVQGVRAENEFGRTYQEITADSKVRQKQVI